MAATQPSVLLAAGGTGGHLFPAEALAAALAKHGVSVDLATDERATRYGDTFPARAIHIVTSDTFRSRNPIDAARTIWRLGFGFGEAFGLLGRMRPMAVVGFGGYPSIPTVLAARARRLPIIVHEQNAVMGRANRLLAGRANAIATSFPGVLQTDLKLGPKATFTGNPVRPPVLAAAARPYDPPWPNGDIDLLVFGGSQGARIMAEIVPSAFEHLEPALRGRIRVVQQARDEDERKVRDTYERLGVKADIAPFFRDLPARIAAAHLVVGRAGASTVAELSVIGRPAILVPLPHSLDQDQLANAIALQAAGGAIVMKQAVFTPELLASELSALATNPKRLSDMAQSARAAGAPDAADRLADLVLRVAGIQSPAYPASLKA